MKTKIILLSTFILIISVAGYAQLENSKWSGTFMIPSEANCYFNFKKDTVTFHFAETDEVIETMKYNISKDTISFTKISGGSPCNDDEIGIYNWKIESDKLIFKLVNDDCEGRSSAFVNPEMVRMKTAEAVKPKE